MSVVRSLAVFFSLGALLFAASRIMARDDAEPVRIEVPEGATPAAIENLKREAVLVREARLAGAQEGDPALLQWIAEALPDDRRTREDVLAMLRMGLEDRDPVIRRRLIFWGERLLEGRADTEATDAELRAHLETERERFVRPARVRFELVHFSRSRRGDEARAHAEAATLPSEGEGIGEAYRLGDPHMHLRPVLVREPAEVSRSFGEAVARVAGSIEPGRWSAPIEGRGGFFRLRVLERERAESPPLDEVRDAVFADLMRARRARALREGIDERLAELEFEVIEP